MTDMTTNNDNQPLAMTASEECSPALWRRLTDKHIHFEQVTKELAHYCRDELERVADRLAKHAEPCGGAAVIANLTPLVTLYGVSDKSAAEWKTFWRFYIEALGELPLEALADGVSDYVARRDSEFFPKPGPLKSICDEHATSIRTAVGRARRALQIAPREAERYCR
jgi:hypothetical protein